MTFYFNKCSTKGWVFFFLPSMIQSRTHPKQKKKNLPSRNFVITFLAIIFRSFICPPIFLQKTKKTISFRLFASYTLINTPPSTLCYVNQLQLPLTCPSPFQWRNAFNGGPPKHPQKKPQRRLHRTPSTHFTYKRKNKK